MYCKIKHFICPVHSLMVFQINRTEQTLQNSYAVGIFLNMYIQQLTAVFQTHMKITHLFSLHSLLWRTKMKLIYGISMLCFAPLPTFEWLNKTLWDLVCISWPIILAYFIDSSRQSCMSMCVSPYCCLTSQ